MRGGVSTTVATGLLFVLRVGSTVLFARLLMPEDFGLIGMVTALTVVAEQFKDLGLSLATVQSKTITHQQVSTLFWINAVIGILIMAIVAALSWPIAWFYGDHRLIPITIALSSSFFFGGFAVQHQALLRRQMRFTRLAWIQVIPNALSVIVGIVIALRGYGYWALVWKEVARAAFTACGMWLACRWMPGLPSFGSDVGKMLRFGRNVSASNIMTYFSRNIDKVLIGKFLGASPLGFYRQASQLVMIPISFIDFPVNYVAEPTFSALQGDPERYRNYYKKLISLISFLSMPLMVYFCIFSGNLVRLILGEKWMEAAPIFEIIAIGGLIQPVVNTCGFVMITCGKTERFFKWGLMRNIFIVGSFCIGVNWGTVGVAAAYVLASYLILIPSLWYGFEETPITVSVFFEMIMFPLFTSIVMGTLLLEFRQNVHFGGNDMTILISLPLAVSAYFGTWLLVPGGRQKLGTLISHPYEAYKSLRLARSK